jgi:hypothetical protein
MFLCFKVGILIVMKFFIYMFSFFVSHFTSIFSVCISFSRTFLYPITPPPNHYHHHSLSHSHISIVSHTYSFVCSFVSHHDHRVVHSFNYNFQIYSITISLHASGCSFLVVLCPNMVQARRHTCVIGPKRLPPSEL